MNIMTYNVVTTALTGVVFCENVLPGSRTMDLQMRRQMLYKCVRGSSNTHQRPRMRDMMCEYVVKRCVRERLRKVAVRNVRTRRFGKESHGPLGGHMSA